MVLRTLRFRRLRPKSPAPSRGACRMSRSITPVGSRTGGGGDPAGCARLSRRTSAIVCSRITFRLLAFEHVVGDDPAPTVIKRERDRCPRGRRTELNDPAAAPCQLKQDSHVCQGARRQEPILARRSSPELPAPSPKRGLRYLAMPDSDDARLAARSTASRLRARARPAR